MGKLVVFKPVVWNDSGYTWPAGITASTGYSNVHGYGHEEWNGRSDWVWKGWKVFHTQAKGRMHEYAEEGRLGIIMTTMRDGKFVAVGVGCGVCENSAADNEDIAEALGLDAYVDRLWQVPSVRERYVRRASLESHWRGNRHVNWRCPQSHFAWFGEPVPIIPNDLIPDTPPRQAIVKMHGSYQGIRPDQALAVVRQALAPDHPIIGWLSTDDFDPVRNRRVRNARPPKGGGGRSASTAIDPVVRYMQEYELVVTPRHHILQDDFRCHLLKISGTSGVAENIERVDLRYIDKAKGSVLVEIKPTEPATVRFAIRAAMGQLLDYRHSAGGVHTMLIVIDDLPSEEDVGLAIENGFGIAWRAKDGFAYRWPSA